MNLQRENSMDALESLLGRGFFLLGLLYDVCIALSCFKWFSCFLYIYAICNIFILKTWYKWYLSFQDLYISSHSLCNIRLDRLHKNVSSCQRPLFHSYISHCTAICKNCSALNFKQTSRFPSSLSVYSKLKSVAE